MKEIELKIESVEDQAEVIQFLEDKVYEHNSSTIHKYEGITIYKDHPGSEQQYYCRYIRLDVGNGK